MKKIKWENIFTILYVGFAIYQTIYHIGLNGLYVGLVAELFIHLMFTFGFHYIIKDIRKNPTEWEF
jgi:hypothetical protein